MARPGGARRHPAAAPGPSGGRGGHADRGPRLPLRCPPLRHCRRLHAAPGRRALGGAGGGGPHGGGAQHAVRVPACCHGLSCAACSHGAREETRGRLFFVLAGRTVSRGRRLRLGVLARPLGCLCAGACHRPRHRPPGASGSRACRRRRGTRGRGGGGFKFRGGVALPRRLPRVRRRPQRRACVQPLPLLPLRRPRGAVRGVGRGRRPRALSRTRRPRVLGAAAPKAAGLLRGTRRE